MSRISASSILEDTIELLIQHFGVDRVRAALAKLTVGDGEAAQMRSRRASSKPNPEAIPSVKYMLEQLRLRDEEKYGLLSAFYAQLKDRKVLADSQDILYFAQLVGLKNIPGKSRKDMIPKLIRYLLDYPTERLRIDIEKAKGISEQQRLQGFSVLTDKLLGGK